MIPTTAFKDTKMVHPPSYFTIRLTGALSLIVLVLDLLHIQYLEAQRRYDDEVLKISSATRAWQYGLWMCPGLVTLAIYLVRPVALRLRRFSKMKQEPTLSCPAILILAIALLYFPVQELVVSLFFASVIHGLASFGSSDSDGSTGSLALTFRRVHFCGSREVFEVTLPQRHQNRVLELSESGSYGLRDDTYSQCQIIRARSCIMIPLGPLVMYQFISANRTPATDIHS